MNAFFSEQELRRFFTDSKIIQDGEETSDDVMKDDFRPNDKFIESPQADIVTYKKLAGK